MGNRKSKEILNRDEQFNYLMNNENLRHDFQIKIIRSLYKKEYMHFYIKEENLRHQRNVQNIISYVKS